MDPANLVAFTSQDLKAGTNNFDDNNLIGTTESGRLFRGIIQNQHVLVKIWEGQGLESLSSKYNDEYLFIKEEVKFWTNPTIKGHPNLVTIIGCCCEKEVKGIFYDLNPLDTLHNLIIKDELNWIKRIEVIHEVAKLMEFLHCQERQTSVLNISSSHILLDKDYKPRLFDLLMRSQMKTLKEELTTSTAYLQRYNFSLGGSERDRSSEVYSFGIILLELITKRFSDMGKRENTNQSYDNLVHIWAKKEYKRNCCLVHKSLQEDWYYHAEDGIELTLLGMQCIEFFAANRPTMKDVLLCLENLKVLRRLGDARPTKREKNNFTSS